MKFLVIKIRGCKRPVLKLASHRAEGERLGSPSFPCRCPSQLRHSWPVGCGIDTPSPKAVLVESGQGGMSGFLAGSADSTGTGMRGVPQPGAEGDGDREEEGRKAGGWTGCQR